MNINKCGIIIQARAGSSRLPSKMLMPFYNHLTILEIMIKNLLDFFDKCQIIIATTINKIDDEIAETGKKLNVNIFRGDENDVLKRFIDAAEYFGISTIIRICADNPFLQATEVKRLYNEYAKLPVPVDYFSFAFPDKTPVIKSHLGLFAEVTTLVALKKVALYTEDNFFHEHVTNYIYANSNKFNVSLIGLPDNLKSRKDLRMTIDTLEDFNLLKDIFGKLVTDKNYHISSDDIISYININQNILTIMADEIRKNSK